MPEEIELSEERSQQLALIIKDINWLTLNIDVDYAKAVIKATLDSCSFQDSAAALNAAYNPEKVNLARQKMKGLQFLVQYIETMHSVTKKQQEIERSDEQRKHITDLFF